jgi:multidrug efflux system membrane fusion protein
MLFPSQFVNVKLLINTLHDAVSVPAAAIQRGPNGDYVYVVKDDDTVEMRPVTTDLTQKETTVVAKGLRAGEVVVTDGVDKLRDGAAVSVRHPGDIEDTSAPASRTAATAATEATGAAPRAGRGARRGNAPGPQRPGANASGGSARGSQ